MSGAGLRVLATALRRGGGDRRRTRWTALALAGAGVFGCGAVAIATLAWGDAVEQCTVQQVEIDGVLTPMSSCWTPPQLGNLAPYLAQPGLRVGVVAGALCLVLPFVLLAVQTLRFGAAARERRLAALAVAGAGRAELRRIGALEAVHPALLGAALTPMLYLLLWLALGRALPPGWRMLPATPWSGLLAWPLVSAVLVGAAAASGARAARPAVVTPLGLARRAPRPMTRGEAVLPAVLVTAFVVSMIVTTTAQVDAAVWLALACLVGAAVSLGTPTAAFTGRFLVRRGTPTATLAGRRLLADPRTPGRVGGVLLAVGLSIGIEVGFGVGLVAPPADPEAGNQVSDLAFYLIGVGAAALATLVAAAVALGSLAVGAAEHLLDTARPTAALVALGASRSDVAAVLRSWLRAASMVPALVGGVLGAGLMILALSVEVTPAWAIGSQALALGVCFGVAASGSAVAGRLLRGVVAAVSSAENLRTG